MKYPSLYLDRAVLHLDDPHTAHFGLHTEITLQDVPNGAYTLRLFLANVEREVQMRDNHTWTPAQRLYVH